MECLPLGDAGVSLLLSGSLPVTEIDSHFFTSPSSVALAGPHTAIPVSLGAFKSLIFAESIKAYGPLERRVKSEVDS